MSVDQKDAQPEGPALSSFALGALLGALGFLLALFPIQTFLARAFFSAAVAVIYAAFVHASRKEKMVEDWDRNRRDESLKNHSTMEADRSIRANMSAFERFSNELRLTVLAAGASESPQSPRLADALNAVGTEVLTQSPLRLTSYAPEVFVGPPSLPAAIEQLEKGAELFADIRANLPQYTDEQLRVATANVNRLLLSFQGSSRVSFSADVTRPPPPTES